jgi:hypothetical protein
VTCAEYSLKHGLLETHGWKQFNQHAKNQKKLQRMINQYKLCSYFQEPFWKISVLVPRTHAQAVELDQKNGNTLWQVAEATEMKQLLEYNTFIDKGKGAPAPTEYKQIR